eukprot:scaffold2504_cov65-Phaeocystis_antarctica.AAC.4
MPVRLGQCPATAGFRWLPLQHLRIPASQRYSRARLCERRVRQQYLRRLGPEHARLPGSEPAVALCAAVWCYVDMNKCRSSTLRYQKSGYYPTISGLFYSYETCGGDHSAFTSFERLKTASNQHTLTVVLPSVALCETPRPPALACSEAPLAAGIVTRPAPGSPAASGPHVPLQARSTGRRAAHLERTLRAQPLPRRQRALGGRPRTVLRQVRGENVPGPWQPLMGAHMDLGLVARAALLLMDRRGERRAAATPFVPEDATVVNDVALGIADVGCSLFWITAERLEMSSFTANLLSDQFYLFVPKPKVDDG